jgi:hypothetical protein
VSTKSVYDTCERGLTRDGVTNDQHALAALVNRLGDTYRKDGRLRVIFVPPGNYRIQDAAATWRSGVSLVGADMHATPASCSPTPAPPAHRHRCCGSPPRSTKPDRTTRWPTALSSPFRSTGWACS